MKTSRGALDFLVSDSQRSLFPLRTNVIVAQRAQQAVVDYLNMSVLNKEAVDQAFLQQRRVYAEKSDDHIRRTIKLDPIADYFIYSLVYSNHRLFRKSSKKTRKSFGYYIRSGAPVPGTTAYADFRGAIRQYGSEFKHALQFDVATYFNNIYHHDIVHWFHELGAGADDVEHLGQFLREINSGRSVDCMPQGIYPTKMIGHHFLRSIDEHLGLRCAQTCRFMDDFLLFDDDQNVIRDDFYRIQKLLGEKGLSVNPAKTKVFDDHGSPTLGMGIDDIKLALLLLRRDRISDYDDTASEEVTGDLTREQTDYLKSLLKDENISEEDSELVLSLLDQELSDSLEHLRPIVEHFPNLAKRLHSFCARIPDKEGVGQLLLEILRANTRLGEYQLFWFGCMLEDYLLGTSAAGELFHALLEAPNATPISRAKVLEISEKRFGMLDCRNEHLRSGSSDWLVWSSAIGSRDVGRAARNQALKYIGKHSPMNHLIELAVRTFEPKD